MGGCRSLAFVTFIMYDLLAARETRRNRWTAIYSSHLLLLRKFIELERPNVFYGDY